MFFKHTWIAIVWALLILILCGMPGKDIPHISFLELISFDKFVHAALFLVLTYLFIRGFAAQTSSGFLSNHALKSAFLLCVIYGAFLELLQDAVFEDRTADLYDFIANTVGCIAGTFIYKKYSNRLKKSLDKRLLKRK